MTAPLPSISQWEKTNMPISGRVKWLRAFKIFFAESQRGYTLSFDKSYNDVLKQGRALL